jgi:hypothetical protein
MRVAKARVALVAAMLSVTLGVAAPAFAATPISPGASAATTSAPQPSGGGSAATTSSAQHAPLVSGDLGVQVGVDPAQGTVVVIVGVTLGNSAPLPARVRVPVPANSAIVWAGEILGGDPGADPQKEYTLATGEGGGQYAEFTLTGSHQGQIEVNAGALPTGKSVSAKTTFVQSTPSNTTAFAVRMPSGAQSVHVEPTPVATPEFNDAGESLYTLETKNVPVGSKVEVSFTYTKGAPTAGPSSSSAASTPSQSSTPLIVLLAGSAIVFLVAAVYIARRSDEGTESGEDFVAEDDGERDGEGEDASPESDEDDESDAGDGTDEADELDESDDPFSDLDAS